VLGIIIFVHEFGHLITAKAFGMRVFVFSFGFGKRLFGFKWARPTAGVGGPLGLREARGRAGDHISETRARWRRQDFLSRPRCSASSSTSPGPDEAVLTIAVLSASTCGFAVEGSRYDRTIVVP